MNFIIDDKVRMFESDGKELVEYWQVRGERTYLNCGEINNEELEALRRARLSDKSTLGAVQGLPSGTYIVYIRADKNIIGRIAA